MSTWGESMFEHFETLDRALVAAGFPATSPWWKATVRRFLVSGKRQLVARVGRRGGKSSTLCRLVVTLALFGEHAIPPGDVGVTAFISTTRDEAAQRLRTIEAILKALRLAHRPIENGLELVGKSLAFKCFACSVASVSGFTGIAIVADEVSKWRDSDTGANPAKQVLAAVRPTMATQPNARSFLVSSPLATLDAHYDAFEQGETGFQCVAFAPTWEANSSLTEDDCRALEPDDATFRREYAAIPATQLDEALFDSAELKAITTSATELRPEPNTDYCAAIDPAFRGDIFALVIGMRSRGIMTDSGAMIGSKVVRIAAVREWQGTKASPLAPETTLKAVAAVLKPYGISSVFSDQHSADALVEIGARIGLRIITEATTQASKLEAFESLRVQVRAGELQLVDVPSLRSDLLNVRRRITRSGVTIELPRVGGRHCDTAVAVARVAAGLRAVEHIPAPAPEVGARWENQPLGGYADDIFFGH